MDGVFEGGAAPVRLRLDDVAKEHVPDKKKSQQAGSNKHGY